MKMSKRIFIALLIVSVIVSVFTFSTFAYVDENYDYDYYFVNDKSFDEAERAFCDFLRSIAE